MTIKTKRSLKSTVAQIVDSNDREHLRAEIDVRTLFRELHEIRELLRRGSEMALDDEGELFARPLGDTRLKTIKHLIDLDMNLVHLALPALKAVASVTRLPTFNKEAMEPQNIRASLVNEVVKGNITAETAKQVAEVAGMKSELDDDSSVPQSFTVNISTVDGREVDDVGNPVINDDDDEPEIVGDDMGDAFIMDAKHKGVE